MVSLQDFSYLPKPGEVSLYEKDGQLCSLPASEIDLTNFSGSVCLNEDIWVLIPLKNCHPFQLVSYPDINVSRELSGHHSSTSHEDNRTVLIPGKLTNTGSINRSVECNRLIIGKFSSRTFDQKIDTNIHRAWICGSIGKGGQFRNGYENGSGFGGHIRLAHCQYVQNGSILLPSVPQRSRCV